MKDNPIFRPVREKLKPLELVLKADQTISDALTIISISSIDSQNYLYVTDHDLKLCGVVSLKKLLTSNPLKLIQEVMDKKVLYLEEHDPIEKALEIFSEHHFYALPVLSKDRNLIGFIDLSSSINNELKLEDLELRSDAFQLVGLHLESYRRKSVLKNYFMRMPWLFCNLFGGLTCAFISDIYSMVLSKFLVLAMFIPLVLALSESVSMQTVMQVLLLIRKEGISFKRYIKMYLKEVQVVSLISLTCAFIVAILSPFWGEGIGVALVIGFGIFISIFISSFWGAILPIFFRKLNLDPKIASGPVVLMFADIGTTIIYLTLATFTLT